MADIQGTISGSITAVTRINGKIKNTPVISGDISTAGVIYRDLPSYEGEYTVTPSVNSQTLETAGKKMDEDLTVKSIPYFETSNQYGYTVYIGSEV